MCAPATCMYLSPLRVNAPTRKHQHDYAPQLTSTGTAAAFGAFSPWRVFYIATTCFNLPDVDRYSAGLRLLRLAAVA